MAYFWYFLGYGFLGYLLEKLFAALTHAEHRVRKGFLLAPVCPVYGLAMCAVLALGADRIGPLWELALLCSITATTAEYAVHLFCDAVLGVRFWDYSATKRTSTAVSVCRSRSRGACSVRSPCASCSPRWRLSPPAFRPP